MPSVKSPNRINHEVMPMPQVISTLNFQPGRCPALANHPVRGYIPARGLAYLRNPISNLFTRIKLAWGVFTGRYDALNWHDRE